MKKYEEFTKGFITASKEFLTKEELDTMALGAIVITIELASRFLADHINGDMCNIVNKTGDGSMSRVKCVSGVWSY